MIHLDIFIRYVVRKLFSVNELRLRLEEEQQKVIGMIQSGGHVAVDPTSRASTPNATNIQLEVTLSSFLGYILSA